MKVSRYYNSWRVAFECTKCKHIETDRPTACPKCGELEDFDEYGTRLLYSIVSVRVVKMFTTYGWKFWQNKYETYVEVKRKGKPDY